MPARCSFSQPDPLGLLSPAISPYIFCNADPVNYIDPTGLYGTEEAIDDFNRLFPGHSNTEGVIHQDTATGEWYIAMDESRPCPYTSGEVLTRYFGPNSSSPPLGPQFFSISISVPTGGEGVGDSRTAWESFMIGTNAFGSATSFKLEMIDYAAKSASGEVPKGMSKNEIVAKAFGKAIGNYTQVTRLITKACVGMSIGTTFYDLYMYYNNGGDGFGAAAWAAVDIGVAAIGYFGGPAGWAASTVYFLATTYYRTK